MTVPRNWRPSGISLCLVACLAALAFNLGSRPTAPLQAQSGAEKGAPSVVRPQARQGGGRVDLEAGENLLLAVLQAFATSVGKKVWVAGEVPLAETVTLDRRIQKLDFDTLRQLLEKHGLDVHEETFRKEDVYWVSKRLQRPRKRGRLVRRDEPSPETGKPAPSYANLRDATERLQPTGDPAVRAFQRVDGKGGGFLVTVEVESREEAEEVSRTIALILRDRRKNR